MLKKIQQDVVEAQLLVKAGPPGPPPRPGLEWNEQSHRWIRPKRQGDGVPAGYGHGGAAPLTPDERSAFSPSQGGREGRTYPPSKGGVPGELQPENTWNEETGQWEVGPRRRAVQDPQTGEWLIENL